MEQKIQVPDLGGHASSKVIEVIVNPGDQIQQDQGLITVESEKAAMEIPSPFAGTIVSCDVAVGDEVSPGDVIMVMDVDQAEARSTPKVVDAPVRKEVVESAKRPASTKASGRAGPFARRIAHEMDIDLKHVRASGSSGQVTVRDIKDYLQQRTASIEVDLSHYPNHKRLPLSRARVYTAKSMTQAWQSVPQVCHHMHIDITALEALRQKHKATCQNNGGKLTLMPILIKVMARLLERHPEFNRIYVDESDYAQLDEVHVSVAVDTPNGLMVPVIRDIAHKDIMSLSRELPEVAKLAADGKLKVDQMKGGSVTISSLGGIVGGFFTPIINSPQAAILGVTKAELQPHIHDGEICSRLMLPVSLTYDHRLIDGASAARFLADLTHMLNMIPADVGDDILLYS